MLNLQPLTLMPNESPVIGRRVEVVRHAAVAIRRAQQRVVRFRHTAAERDELLEHLPE